MRRNLLAAVIAALAVGAGVGLAAIPSKDGTIHACRKIESGRLRAVASADRCRKNERPLKWNMRGRRGRQGPPGPGLLSFDALAGLACTNGSVTGAIAIEYDASGGVHLRCDVAPSSVRINEISTATEGALTDEFVEIFNAGTGPADLSGYRIVYRSATGTSDVAVATLPEGTSLAPGAFFLLGGAGYAGAHPADKTFATALASHGGGLGIRGPAGLLVDAVGWGTATNAFVEGTAAPAPPVAPAPGKSAGRHPDGDDANDNAADFTIMELPTPGAAN